LFVARLIVNSSAIFVTCGVNFKTLLLLLLLVDSVLFKSDITEREDATLPLSFRREDDVVAVVVDDNEVNLDVFSSDFAALVFFVAVAASVKFILSLATSVLLSSFIV